MNDVKGCVDKIKSSKPFKLWDILIYSLILALIALMFIAIFVIAPKKDITGFKITLNDTTVVDYSFNDNSILINSDFRDRIKYNQTSNTITVYTNEQKTEYNIISFSLENKTVWISESNCSDSKDCVHFEPISSGEQIIYCLPHNLKVVSTGGKVNNTPSTGSPATSKRG